MQKGSAQTRPSGEPRRSFEVPRALRRLMRLAEMIHWRLALLFALRLFFTPIKFSVPKREHAIRKTASQQLIPAGSQEAQLFEWGKSGKKVLLMHGWSGRASQFFRLTEKLVQEGYHVFSIEAPAHGESKERQTDMLEFVQAIEWTCQNKGPFAMAIGHSLGGVALFNAHARLGGSFENIITIGTPANINNVVSDFCAVVGASERVAKGIIRRIQKDFKLNVEDVSTDKLAAEWNPPGAIFHDEQDADVPVVNARQLAKAWENATLEISDGLGHRRILSEPKIHHRIIQLLQH